MKHCCIPRPKTTVSSMVSRKTLVLGYHLHRETQYFHLHRETIFPLREIPEPCFSPQSPQTAHDGGESPTPFPNLSLRVLKCPFRALSPCPIQILAGALLPISASVKLLVLWMLIGLLVGLNIQMNELMKLNEYQRSRSLFDLGHRSLRFQN